MRSSYLSLMFEGHSLIKRFVSHPSRVAIGGCDNQTVLISGLSIQRISQKKKANPVERGEESERTLLLFYTQTFR